jgi:hypothetical protein
MGNEKPRTLAGAVDVGHLHRHDIDAESSSVKGAQLFRDALRKSVRVSGRPKARIRRQKIGVCSIQERTDEGHGTAFCPTLLDEPGGPVGVRFEKAQRILPGLDDPGTCRQVKDMPDIVERQVFLQKVETLGKRDRTNLPAEGFQVSDETPANKTRATRHEVRGRVIDDCRETDAGSGRCHGDMVGPTVGQSSSALW